MAETRKAHIFTFARTFSDIEHAKAFLRGSVRMQTIEYFRKLESTDKALRGDAYEGLSAIFQPASISQILIAGISLPPTALAAPLSLHSSQTKSWHVFCLHTIGATPEDPEHFESLEDMRKAFLLDEKCTALGTHVVYFTTPKAFLERVHASIKAHGFSGQSQLVRYFDDVLFSGHFDDSEIAFRKAKKFAYQKEYRVVAKTPSGIGSPLILDIGDISDIAQLTTAEEFNNSLTIRVAET